jgi:hypothetical protein
MILHEDISSSESIFPSRHQLSHSIVCYLTSGALVCALAFKSAVKNKIGSDLITIRSSWFRCLPILKTKCGDNRSIESSTF